MVTVHLTPLAVLVRAMALIVWQTIAMALWILGLLFHKRKSMTATVVLAQHSASIAASSVVGSNSLTAVVTWIWVKAAAVLNFMRSTMYRCLRAAHAVTNFLVTVVLAIVRHRVSLTLQAKQTAMNKSSKIRALVASVGKVGHAADAVLDSDGRQDAKNVDSDQGTSEAILFSPQLN
ncbi:hypothetical protein CEUSTIGMA_g5604.t1 [Chlamydomonas eustigma]|uniref:Uncharacterized protein n=1 Tax=Chlamydomonas eustigma TaxID=1157962 RepID=A0A250X5J0_9CHLO|nr:hypothetical protein CEUSTIGMA_g5604.t1 [Chlamydomonas eustigma]|eukprot:GAX78162.1 hypothetical protein CEUSTIGMA_g5604.t1 [Chlamydomonas eustigma]